MASGNKSTEPFPSNSITTTTPVVQSQDSDSPVLTVTGPLQLSSTSLNTAHCTPSYFCPLPSVSQATSVASSVHIPSSTSVAISQPLILQSPSISISQANLTSSSLSSTCAKHFMSSHASVTLYFHLSGCESIFLSFIKYLCKHIMSPNAPVSLYFHLSSCKYN